MEWLNIHASFLDSPHFVGSEPLDRATWLCLLRYCCGQENGGLITQAKAWGDRKWQQLVRVTKAEVERPSDLWKWDGDDLAITGYPNDMESYLRSKRAAGRLGGQARSQAKSEASKANGAKHEPKQNPSKDPSRSQAEPNVRKGKVRKGKVMKGNVISISPDAAAPGLDLARLIYAAYPRKVGPAAALRAINKALHTLDPTYLEMQTKAFADACSRWPEEDRRFIPHPATWFNRGSYNDDPATWERQAPGNARTARTSEEEHTNGF